MSHFTYALLLGSLVSAGMAFSERRPTREQVYRAAYLFLCCIVVLIAGSWIMRAIHG
jgi:hypothetical protein